MITLNALPQRLRLTPAADSHEAFEESYLKPGMLVNLIAVNRYSNYDNPEIPGQEHCYELILDADPYYDFNLKLMPEVYFPNNRTPKGTDRKLFTAVEAGWYTPQEKVYVCIAKDSADPMAAVLAQIEPLFEAEVPDAVATKEAHSRLLGSHQRLRDALKEVVDSEWGFDDLRTLLDEAERIEKEAKHVLG